jgi:tetratricopeptide (TPR) repeat protein
MKLKILLDNLNIASPLTYPSDFSLTEAEKTEWTQKIARYASDPPSPFPPVRLLLNRQAELLIELGDYKQALAVLNPALSMADQRDDKDTKAMSVVLLAVIKARSGDVQSSIEMLASASGPSKMPMPFWLQWYTAAFLIERSDFTMAMLNQFRMACVRPDLSIAEQILVYQVYITATRHLSPEATADIWETWIKSSLPRSASFLPAIDVELAFHWRSLLSPSCPRSLPHFRELGHELLELIEKSSSMYDAAAAKNDNGAIPILCRYVDAINLFGALALKYAPVLREIETNGLNIAALGSHASLLNEFLDKTQEPLPELSAAAAVLHFNAVQNIANLPKKYVVKMDVYLGQCLHSISTDTVTLQNAVKALWKAAGLLLELEQFDLAGDVASELYGVLKESDPPGAIYQYLLSQAALAYKTKMQLFVMECDPTNREWLFVREADRLRFRFMNPEISPMFTVAKKYFATIPNGTSLLRLSRTMDQIKAWAAANKILTIVILDDLPDYRPHLTAAVISFRDQEKLQSVAIDIDLDESAMKYEIFRQIIAPTKAPPPAEAAARTLNSPSGKGKRPPAKKTPGKAPVIVVPVEDPSASFAKDAVKLNHPEFTKYIADLDQAFEPLKDLLIDHSPDSALFISSIRSAHAIPLEIMVALAGFAPLYRDLSIMSAMNRKAPSVDPPSYGNVC